MKDQTIKILETIKSIDPPFQNIVEQGKLRNIQVVGKKIEIDLITNNPSLSARKKWEVDILQTLNKTFDYKYQVNINITVEKVSTTEPQTITQNTKSIPGIKNTIAISSGKGGVGKSTVTTNLAIALQKKGFKVGILDADVYGPSIPTMFDITFEKPQSVEINGKNMIKPINSYDISVMSLGFFANADQAVAWRGPMATKALQELLFHTNWGELDFLLIDLPPGTGDIHLSLVQSLPLTGAVIISTPQKIALTDARKGIALYQIPTIQVPILGLIENMSFFVPEELPDNKYYIFGKEGAKNLAKEKEISFLGEIPIIQSIREAADAGYPSALKTEHPVQPYYKTIVENLVTQVVKRNKDLPPTEITRITNMVGCSAK